MQCPNCQRTWPNDYNGCPKCMIPFGRTVAAERSIAAGANVVFAEGGATVVIGEAPVPMTAVDRESALGRYLQHVISRNRYLQLQGIRSGGRLVHIELDRIYVTLRATRQRLIEVEEEWLEREAALAPGELCRLGERPSPPGGRTTTETVTVSVNEALAAHRRLAVLGDPGSGKTTLLRYLALLYARDLAEGSTLVADKLGLDESGCLPVLLPLRQIGAYLRAHRPADDGTEGCGQLLDFLTRSLENQRITLPSEAEWEKVARGPSTGSGCKREFPWGDEFEATRCNSSELGLGNTTPVGIFPEGASPYGVLDLSGNVWEWTRSVYKGYPYDPADGRENLELDDNGRRVLRGGAFDFSVRGVRCAFRNRIGPKARYNYLGFRVVVAPVPLGSDHRESRSKA